jgi:hypothetical protein
VLPHENALHSTPIIIDDSYAEVAALLIKTRCLEAECIENSSVAAAPHGSILCRAQYFGSNARTAQIFLDPECMNGKPTESHITN